MIDDTAEKTGQGENKIDKVSPESFRGPRETCMYAQLRVKRFSMFGTALCLAACASAQTADLPPHSPAAISPISSHVVLEKLPPSALTITYDNGVLTISAYNSTLSDILRGIRTQTGADVDIPPQAEERVVTHLGPGPASMSSVPYCRGLGLTTSSWDRMPTPTHSRGFCCFPGQLRRKYPSDRW